MDEKQRYLFDLQGYVVVTDALDAEVVRALNHEIDRMMEAEAGPEATTQRFGRLVERSHLFRALLDNPPVVPFLESLLGEDFRLDHDYADVIRRGDGPIGHRLHGGAVPFRPAEYYWSGDGRLHSGLLVVAYALKDVSDGDGGFGCVPGSHKSVFRFPDEWKDLAESHDFVKKVTGPAGSAVIFTEALVHGTLPWHGEDERRTLFYKYSPAPISWARTYYDGNAYDDLTPRQRAILRAPSTRPIAEYANS